MIAMFVNLTLLGIGGAGVQLVLTGLKQGQVYSPIWGPMTSELVYRAETPVKYWAFIAFYALTSIVIFIVTIFSIREIVIEQKRKNAAKKAVAK
jgi:hypothetical protein